MRRSVKINNLLGGGDFKSIEVDDELKKASTEPPLVSMVFYSKCEDNNSFINPEIGAGWARFPAAAGIYSPGKFNNGAGDKTAVNLEIDYDTGATTRFLNDPGSEGSGATDFNLIPTMFVFTSTIHIFQLNLGLNLWQRDIFPNFGGITDFLTWVGPPSPGTPQTYGQIKFDPSTKVWDNNMAGAEPDGLKRFNFKAPFGFFDYFYAKVPWQVGFGNQNHTIVISQAGSVYRNSISAGNLVVAHDGTVGPSGGGSGIAPYYAPEDTPAVQRIDVTTVPSDFSFLYSDTIPSVGGFSFWINPDSYPGTMDLLRTENSGATGTWDFKIQFRNSGTPKLAIIDKKNGVSAAHDGETTIDLTTEVPLSKSTHIAWVTGRGSKNEVYINGYPVLHQIKVIRRSIKCRSIKKIIRVF